MWYVEASIGDKFERWEGLTNTQAVAVRQKYFDQGINLVRIGLADEN